MRAKWLWAAIAVIAGLLVLPGAVGARATMQGDTCVVEAATVIEGNLYALCGTLIIDGTVTGDVIGAALYVTINGTVQGNVYLAAGQLDVRGTLEDDLAFAGAALRVHPGATLSGETSGLTSLGLSTEIREDATIPHNVTAVNYQFRLDGAVDGEINFWGSALIINGAVGGDVEAVVGDPAAGDGSQLQTLLLPFRLEVSLGRPGLTVTENGSVGGRLRYSGPAAGSIDGTLAEDPVYAPTENLPDLTQLTLGEQSTLDVLQKYLSHIAAEFVVLALVGFAGLAVAPRLIYGTVASLRSRPLASLGVGVLAFLMSFGVMFLLVMLIALVLFLALLLGLPDLAVIAVMAVAVFVAGGGGGFYFVAIYLSRVIVCLAAGRALVRVAVGDDGSARIAWLGLLVGAAGLAVLAWLPVVGVLANGLALSLGLGTLVLLLTQQRGARREPRFVPGVPLPTHSAAARQIPPPIAPDRPRGPGLDNLPEGFSWWDDDAPSR